MTAVAERVEHLAIRAVDGDALALDALLTALTSDLYPIAVRMTGDPIEAEDATQEILIRVATRIASWRRESTFRTWSWRIACNHLLDRRRAAREASVSFARIEELIESGLASPGGQAARDPDSALLVEELMLGCTQAMLLALDRDHRITYVLCDWLGMSGEEVAAVLDVPPATVRKRSQRARERLRAFMGPRCGLVNSAAACRCEAQVAHALRRGVLDPKRPLSSHPRRDPCLRDAVREVEDLERVIAVFREHPEYVAPERIALHVRAFLDAATSRALVG